MPKTIGCAVLTLDGTHFSAKGYEVLARILRPQLIKPLGEPQK